MNLLNTLVSRYFQENLAREKDCIISDKIIVKLNSNHWEPCTVLVTSNVALYNLWFLSISFDIFKTVALFMLCRIQNLIQKISLIKKKIETVWVGEVIQPNPTRIVSHRVRVRVFLRTFCSKMPNISWLLLGMPLQGLTYPWQLVQQLHIAISVLVIHLKILV